MVRATTKADVIEAANAKFAHLRELIDSMSPEQQTAKFDFGEEFLEKRKEAHWARDRNLRDVLIHLYEWHELLLNWVHANQSGDKRPFIPEPYNWRTYGQLNIEFVLNHQSTSLDEAEMMVTQSHRAVMDMIDGFLNDELFLKRVFPWTGTSALGSYCVSATASHYEWAVKKLKAHLKTFA